MSGLKVSWQFHVAIDGGPQLQLKTPNLEVDGYDLVRRSLPANMADFVPIEIQPSNTAGRVVLLVISADRYAKEVAYALSDEDDAAEFPLDGPHLLIGPGALTMLAAAPPTTLFFQNSLPAGDSNLVTVTILVGRKLTP